MNKLLICIVGLIIFGSCAAAPASRLLEVEKRVILGGESEFFREGLKLPCDVGCRHFTRPRDILEASLFLRDGFGPVVRETTRSILQKICGGNKCNASDENLWSDFEVQSRKTYVEPDHSLGEYLSGLNYSLADAWGISEKCEEENMICKFLAKRVRASTYMLSEMVVRQALLEDVGVVVEFSDLVAGMGDMVEPISKQ